MTQVPRKTMLGAATAAPSPVVQSETLLSRAVAATPRGELVTMPILGQVWIELPGEMVVDEIESAVHRAMKALEIPLTPLNALTYDGRRLALTLAWAVRVPDSGLRHVRAGTEQEWCNLDIEALSACGAVYTDVRERLNPMSYPLSAEEFDQIRIAHEKKNPAMLRTFGVISLSSYLATTDAPPANSPTAPPSSGP